MKSTNSRIIGIVDDEIDITELFEDAIKTSISGFSLVSFNDPLIALEHYAENKKDYVLVISDLKLPNLSGLELLKKVKGLNPKVRTILVSAYEVGENDVFQKYVKEGIIMRVQNLKPVIDRPTRLPLVLMRTDESSGGSYYR